MARRPKFPASFPQGKATSAGFGVKVGCPLSGSSYHPVTPLSCPRSSHTSLLSFSFKLGIQHRLSFPFLILNPLVQLFLLKSNVSLLTNISLSPRNIYFPERSSLKDLTWDFSGIFFPTLPVNLHLWLCYLPSKGYSTCLCPRSFYCGKISIIENLQFHPFLSTIDP